MAKTVLGFIPTVLDNRFITLMDTSQYNTDVPVTSPMYRVYMYNFDRYVDLSYVPGSVLHVNTNLLKLTNTLDFEMLGDIPSGLYKIVQSVCPNDKLFIEKYLFNTAPALDCLADLVVENKCDDRKLSKLYKIKEILDLVQFLTQKGCVEDAVAAYKVATDKLAAEKDDCPC